MKVTTDRTPELSRALKALVTNQVLVGIPSGTAGRQPDPGDRHPLNNAEIGYIQENGSPAANIPARPFLKAGVATVQDQVAARLGAAAKSALSGDLGAVEKGLEAVGFIAENAVKAKITDGPFAPLSDSTLAARRARGRTSEKPLIDTGQLRRSVTHVIRPRGRKA